MCEGCMISFPFYLKGLPWCSSLWDAGTGRYGAKGLDVGGLAVERGCEAQELWRPQPRKPVVFWVFLHVSAACLPQAPHRAITKQP